MGAIRMDGGGDPNYIFDASSSGNIDGLGRLIDADETITVPGQGNRHWTQDYTYDRMSQLTAAITDDPCTAGTSWSFGYSYDDAGNIQTKTVNAANTQYSYHGDLMIYAGQNIVWDPCNARLETGLNGLKFYYNWDGKLDNVKDSGSNPLVCFQYDPMGNRVYKWSYDQNTPEMGKRYIVDISGELPARLCKIDRSNSSLNNSCICADRQMIKLLDF